MITLPALLGAQILVDKVFEYIYSGSLLRGFQWAFLAGPDEENRVSELNRGLMVHTAPCTATQTF